MDISLLGKIYIDIYIHSNKVLNVIRKLYRKYIYLPLKIVNNGFWLGVLNRKDFHDLDHYYFSKMQKGYHVSEWNLQGLLDWEKKVIELWFQECHSIMLTGAGAGREVIALERMGYRVDGFECNPDLVKSGNRILKKIGARAELQLMERDKHPEVLKQYDGVIVGWGMYMLIRGRNTRIHFLKGLHTKIRNNGPLLVSFFPRQDRKYYHATARLANLIKALLGREPIEIGDDLIECFYAHHFTKEDITSELREAGFELAHYGIRERYSFLPEYGYAVGCRVSN